MLEFLANTMFGCLHRRTTFPISPRSGRGALRSSVPYDTYVVCLDCGKEFPYSWEEMRILKPEPKRPLSEVGPAVHSLSSGK